MPEKKLTPEQVDQLNANAAQMLEQGYSVDEIKSMASQYFNEFASEEGEPVNFTPASSEQSEGQSEGQKTGGETQQFNVPSPEEVIANQRRSKYTQGQYSINGTSTTKEDLDAKMKDPAFMSKVKSGEIDIKAQEYESSTGEVVEEVKQPVDKFDIASFQIPDMPTDPVSQAKLKAQEQQEKSGQYIQEQIDIWEQAPEIAKRAVDDKNRDSYIKEAEAVINSDKERIKEIEAEFKILTGEDTTGKIQIPPGFTVQDYVKELSEEYTTLNRDVVTTSGALYDAKSDKGWWWGGFKNLLVEGYTSTLDGSVKFLLNTIAQTHPEAFDTEDVDEALVRARAVAKDMAVKETLDLQLKDKSTTEQYIQSVKDKGIITQGVLGAVESIPAMALPAGMFTMSYNAAIDEVQDIEGLTESEKATYATGIATIEAGLEYAGLSKLIKGTPSVTSEISKTLFNKVLKRVPKKSTEDVLQRAVSSEIRTFSDRLKAAADPEKFINAFLVEAETGGTQEAVKLVAQKGINLYKDAELFELPEDIPGNIIESTITEGVGGLTFRGAGAGFSLGKGAVVSLLGGEKNFVANLSEKEFNELSNKLQDPQALQAIKDNIQAQVNLDPNKASQAQKTLEAVEELSGALKSVPADINNRKAVTNLMLDKIRLEKQAENAPDKTIYNKKINSLESKIDELIDAPEIVEETTEQPTTETTTEETTEQTSKESSRLQRKIDKAKSDFASATDIGGKAKAVVRFLNDATASTASVSKEDMAWYKASKAELEAEGYVFDGEIGREVSGGEVYDVVNRTESKDVPKGVRIISRIAKPKRLVNGKTTEAPSYDVIDGTGTTTEREALVAELEAAEDNMTPQNFKEARPRFDAATKALKDYDAANFTSPIQTEINTKTEETVEQGETQAESEVTTEETPLVTDESGEVVTVYRGGKSTSGVQYYTSDQKLAEGIGEGKGEGVQKATVRMANPWTPESLDVNNAPQWMKDWVRSQEEFTTVDEETMAAEEIPMEQAIQEIKDMRLSFRDVGLWQSFVNEALEHHDGIIAFDPSEDMATDKKIYITKSPEQVVTEETTEDTTEGKKEVTNAEKTKIAEEIGKVRKVKPKNIKGLLDVMGGIFGLNKKQAESASVVGDVIIGNMAKRAGISKDEMYQKIAYQKANLEDIEKLSEKGKVLYQIAGENANLTQVIKDNLATARQMEATEDPKTIKIATGWERGADGKWRYETVDNIPFLKDTVRTINKFIVEEGLDNGTGILGGNGELILPLELLELYPQLKDVEIFFDRKMSEYEGAYYPNKNKIVVGLGVRPENSVRVLLHEVQHVIQEVEGFAKGGNAASSFSIKNDIINEYEKELKERGADTDQNLLNSITRKYITGAKNKDVFLEDAGREENRPPFITNRYTFRKKVGTEKIFGREITKYEDLPKGLTFYKNVAGEVEARNVEKRMNMTSEQRRASILEETEDVARDEQVVLFEADGSLKQAAPLIFKSTAKEGIDKIQQKAATPEQWVKMITDKGGKGTSQELEWIGLNDFLNDYIKENNVKSVPKEVVEQYINDNQIEIVEVGKGKGKTLTWQEVARLGELEQSYYEKNSTMDDAQYKEYQELKSRGELFYKPNTKYSEYTLDGGENYREVLLTLPNLDKGKVMPFEEWAKEWYGDISDLSDNQLDLARKQYDSKVGRRSGAIEKGYKSSHWDESNILAHLRINERTLPNGERVMFIEEVQSDWAQEGKKEGFASDLFEGNFRAFVEQEKGLRLNEEELLAEFNNNQGELKKEFLERTDRGKTPDMPYKKTDQWVGMAMRRVMQMAAQEGFDRVAWVTGEQSAERYDLSKQVDKILFEPTNEEGDRYVDVYMPDKLSTFLVSSDGIIISNKNHVIPQSEGKGLDEVIGKELADRILSSESKNTETIENEGLKVGGEGMKTFYNSILPKVTKKEAQRFDKKANVEVVDFYSEKTSSDRMEMEEIRDRIEAIEDIGFDNNDIYTESQKEELTSLRSRYNQLNRRNRDFSNKAPSKQLSIAITPEMRMNLNSAVPLFQGEQGAMLAEDGRFIIYALTDPNVSTPLHELAHVYEHYLTDSERAVIERWSGHSEGTVEFSESFARGFEKFLAGGKVNNPKLQKIFENFKKWLTEIYNGIKGSNIDIQLNSEMKAIYNKMLGSTEETTEELGSAVEQIAKLEAKRTKTEETTDELTSVDVAKDQLKSAWESWKEQQKTLGVVFDPQSKADEDIALARAIIDYSKAVGANTIKDIKITVKDFTNNEIKLNNDGLDYLLKVSRKENIDEKIKKGAGAVPYVDLEKSLKREGYPANEIKKRYNAFLDSRKPIAQQLDNYEKEFEESRNKQREKAKLPERIVNSIGALLKATVDPKIDSKKIFRRLGMQSVLDRMQNLYGTSGTIKFRFTEAYDKIYKGVSSKDTTTLDKIIQLRRFIAIDKNRIKKGLPKIENPGYITGEQAQKLLNKLQERIGQSKFLDLNKRADTYFNEFRGILDRLQDAGIITKELRDELYEIDYQPRKFLNFILEADSRKKTKNEEAWQTGVRQEIIKKLETGSAEELFNNSEWLLSTALSQAETAIVYNKFNINLAKALSDLKSKYDTAKSKGISVRTKADRKLIAEYKRSKDSMILNPNIGVDKNGNPKYKFDTVPDGFSVVNYKVDGVPNQIFIKDEIYNEVYNIIKTEFINPKLADIVSTITGAKLLRTMATGANPAFVLGNLPNDIGFALTFEPAYSSVLPKAMAQLSKDFKNAVVSMQKKDQTYRDFVEYGGMMDFLYTEGALDAKNTTNSYIDKAFGLFTDEKLFKEKKEAIGNGLTYLNQMSEVGIRLGVYKRVFDQEMRKINSQTFESEKNKQEAIENAKHHAVARARNLIDFSQGGTVVKELNKQLPYLNAAFQALYSASQLYYKNPVRSTLIMAQAAGAFTASTMLISYGLIAALKSDDEDEEEIGKIYYKTLDGISDHTKRKYFVIPTGVKNSKGNYEYIKIKKTQNLTPIFTLTEHYTNNAIREQLGLEKESEEKLKNNIYDAISDDIDPTGLFNPNLYTGGEPLKKLGSQLVNRNPGLSAWVVLTTGYDPYRNKFIDKFDDYPELAGYDDPNVQDFYKDLSFISSPARLKVATEKIITNPNTNPFVATVYAFADVTTKDKEVTSLITEPTKGFMKGMTGRMMGETSPYIKDFEQNENLREKLIDIERERMDINMERDDIIQKYISKEINKKQLNEKAKKLSEKLDIEDRKSFIEGMNKRIANPNIPSFYFSVAYSDEFKNDPEKQALKIVDKFGEDILDNPTNYKEMQKTFNKIGFKIGKELRLEIVRLVNPEGADEYIDRKINPRKDKNYRGSRKISPAI